MSAQPVTYKLLLETEERLVNQGAIAARTAANRASTLRRFLKANALNVEDPVGAELRADFPEKSREFAGALAAGGMSPRNVGNTLSVLRRLRGLVIEIDTERAIAGDNFTPFTQAFRALMKDYAVHRLARQTGVPASMLYGWMKGKRPRAGNIPHLKRVEAFFGLEAETLTTLAGFAGGKYVVPAVGEPLKVAYREELAVHTRQHYLLKPTPDSPLRAQWLDFVRYKTDWAPVLARTDRGVWRFAPIPLRVERPANWYEFLDGREVPSAELTWSIVASFLGWLSLAGADGGAGLPASAVQTLAWMAVRERVQQYVAWRVRRVGGRYNGTVFAFFAFAAALLRQESGWLWQQGKFLATLPPEYAGRDWGEMCAGTYSLAQRLTMRWRSQRRQTRDPRAPMRGILESERPLDYVVDMVQRMRADRPLSGARQAEATWARDLALIELLISNPLRRRNLAGLTWRADNTGELYQHPDGSWWVRIPREHFKNTQGAAGASDYDMPVQAAVWRDLERYVRVLRPHLLTFASDYVFVPTPGPQHLCDRPWEGISPRVKELTRKYLWRSPGISPHAFRHLVATAIIKASGLSDFKTAALVLNDRLSTVEQNYAHLKSGDGANRMGELLGDAFRRL
jgi:integrase